MRPKGSKNKTPSKKTLMNAIEQKSMPPQLGTASTFLLGPKTVDHNPVELIRLNKGFVSICNVKNATTIASTPLRLYATKQSKNEKIVFPFKTLNKVEIDTIKREALNLTIKQATDIVEITEHPVFKTLNNVNNDLDYYDLMEITSGYLGLIGNAYWQIIKDSSGLPEKLEVLPAEFVSVMLDSENDISGYRVYNGIYEKKLDRSDVIHFKNVTPGVFWKAENASMLTGVYGMGDLESVLEETYLYNSINDFLRALTENNAIPAGIVKYEGGRLDKNTLKDTENQWNRVLRNWTKAGKVKVMDQDFSFVQLSTNPKELDFAEGRTWLRAVIAAAFGVPEDLLTSANANRASSETAIRNYSKYTILPKLKRLEEKLNYNLISLYDESLFFKFDSPVPADKALDQKQEQIDLSYGVLTINEVRKARGLSDVSWGSSPFQPIKAVGNEGDTNTNLSEEGVK